MLLGNFGLKFNSIPANVIENYDNDVKNYGSLAISLAKKKVLEVAKKHKAIIIGADTIVVLGNKILGKPSSKNEAKQTLKLLSGKTHKVYTGLAIFSSYLKKMHTSCEVTKVKFRKLLNKEIEFYVNSGAPMDKAGAYGIQDDFGSTFIQKIEGDYFNIVGLPLLKTYIGLKEFMVLSF